MEDRESLSIWLLGLIALGVVGLGIWSSSRARSTLPRARLARVQLKSLSTALEAYRVDTGAYPRGLFVGLCRGPREGGGPNPPYFRAGPEDQGRDEVSGELSVLDPWGRPFHYRRGEESFDLWSSGPDGRNDDARPASDDITSGSP